MIYQGTFLGGPRDGEVYAADRNPIILHEASPISADRPPDGDSPPLMSYRTSYYHFHRDDDGRGWWLRD